MTLESPFQLTEFAKLNWMFRGQAEASWDLKTSLERCVSLHEIPLPEWRGIESEIVREFKRAYHEYSAHVPRKGSLIEWLSLMQHYGAPTRLLDFTYSIHTAAYFATEKASVTSAVWAINGVWARRCSIELFSRNGNEAETSNLLDLPFDEDTEEKVAPLFTETRPTKTVCSINPFRLNERLRIQRGVFLAPGDVNNTFMANLRAMPGYDERENLTRILIPVDVAKWLRAQLFDMGVTRRTLFPGLDGYAQSLGVFLPIFNPDDTLRNLLRKP